MQIVHNDILWRQTQEHFPTFYTVLEDWAEQCTEAGECFLFYFIYLSIFFHHHHNILLSGIPELTLAIHCCRAEIFQKLGDTTKFAECLAIVRANIKKAKPSAKLYSYLLSKLRVFNGAVTTS